MDFFFQNSKYQIKKRFQEFNKNHKQSKNLKQLLEFDFKHELM